MSVNVFLENGFSSPHLWMEPATRSKGPAMKPSREATILLVIGIGLLLTSLLADTIGIGDDPGFGRQQTLGTVIGVLITGVGLFFSLLKKS